jgi:hypothetical protein
MGAVALAAFGVTYLTVQTGASLIAFALALTFGVGPIRKIADRLQRDSLSRARGCFYRRCSISSRCTCRAQRISNDEFEGGFADVGTDRSVRYRSCCPPAVRDEFGCRLWDPSTSAQRCSVLPAC